MWTWIKTKYWQLRYGRKWKREVNEALANARGGSLHAVENLNPLTGKWQDRPWSWDQAQGSRPPQGKPVITENESGQRVVAWR